MFGLKIFQVRLEHPKEKIDIVGRLRDFEAAFVLLLVRRSESVLPYGRRIGKSNSQGEFFCDEVNSGQPQRELLQKATQHKEKGLGCFNLVFKLENLLEFLRRWDALEG